MVRAEHPGLGGDGGRDLFLVFKGSGDNRCLISTTGASSNDDNATA